MFLLPCRNISKKYAKIGRFLSTTFREICVTFICHAGHKINESHFFYSMRMRQQRHCFSLVRMISEACRPLVVVE